MENFNVLILLKNFERNLSGMRANYLKFAQIISAL